MRLVDNLLRRTGEPTLADMAVTKADELIENGDESGARRLLFAGRVWSRRARQVASAAGSTGSRLRCLWEQKVVGG